MTEREAGTARPSSRALYLYIALVVILGVVLVLISRSVTERPTDGVSLITLLVLGVLSMVVREPDVGARVGLSFLSIIVISSVVLIGPVGSALVGAVSMACEPRRRPLLRRVFNAAMFAVQGAIGGLVYSRLGGASPVETVTGVTAFVGARGPEGLLVNVGLPLMAADVAQMLVNAAVLAGVVRLSSGVPLRRFFGQIVSNSGVAYIGYGFIGFLFVILWVPADVGPFSALLILAPLFVARWAFVQFGDEQRAHERALSALVTAVETKDPFAVGHSTRIALLATWIAEPLSLGAQDVQALRFAAMLHDVGKVGVPTRILRGRGELSAADLDALMRHPEQGVELVRHIGFLGQSLDGIRHHHERWDGRGYPDGLAGEAIPLASRVIAVADAFDALTTARPARPALSVEEALAELRRREGREFDPTAVAALATAVQRHTWVPAEASADQVAAMRAYVDHDDPVVWERLWTRARERRPERAVVPHQAVAPTSRVTAAPVRSPLDPVVAPQISAP